MGIRGVYRGQIGGDLLNHLTKVFLALLLSSLLLVADAFDLLEQEKIGTLSLGMSPSQLPPIPCPIKKSEAMLWEADGLYHQDWEFIGCGLILDMASMEKEGAKSIESITLQAPSSLATSQGITIGSSRDEVMLAYKEVWNQAHSSDALFVAGSIYGGVMFSFKEGRVVSIFVGAGAE
jgi:hypothetical protein